MCGIAGFFDSKRVHAEAAGNSLTRMAEAIAHRGPDDQGIWFDTTTGIGFGHRRLSIVDLSPLGHQPMTSASGRYTITFNGEIYNYRLLKAELQALGHSFKSTSDTEVLLAAVEQWGVEQTLRRANGMFALGLWDRQDKLLSLARDRFGEKPLYYGQFNGTLLFGSELKALRQHPAWAADLDRDALTLFARHGYIPAPYSVFKQVRKVCAGALLQVRMQGSNFSLNERLYWNTREVMAESAAHPLTGSLADMTDVVEAALMKSISQQMVADVPVGAFLSGGIDSSVVVALMQKSSSRAVQTFSIGFAEKEFNEAPFAKAVAQHIGTQHTELIVSAADTLGVIPKLAQIYDEPLADSSQVPTFLVSQLARRTVTVSLSGDAGDELFGGYSRYPIALARWAKLQHIPQPLRHALAGLLNAAPEWSLQIAARIGQLAGKWRGKTDMAERMREKQSEMRAGNFGELYTAMDSYFRRPGELVISGQEPLTVASSAAQWLPGAEDQRRHMMYVDTCLYMPDDVLVKVDRAAMAVALETRVPMLDPEVARAAWQIPTNVHFKDGRGKWILRQILERHVPRALFDRPKMGFGVPIGAWLRGELRPWAAALLDPARLKREGVFNVDLVQRLWRQHLESSANDWSFHLWTVLTFQAWYEHWNQSATAGAINHSKVA